MDMFWELHQHSKIRRAENQAQKASFDMATAREEIDHLENRINRLALLNRALWSFIEEETGKTEADLADRVREIDLSDGRLDGQVANTKRCPECDRVMSLKHQRCLYCGHEQIDESPLDRT